MSLVIVNFQIWMKLHQLHHKGERVNNHICISGIPSTPVP
jgi:hypothetical protein